MAHFLMDRLYLYRIENTLYHEFLKQNSEDLSYPHTTKVIQKLSHLDIEDPITIICGDNGCGKSTLLKGIAEQLNANRIASYETASVVNDNLFDFLKLKTNRRAKRNFFFTGEDFIKYIEWLENTKKESRDAIREIDEIYGDTYAGMLAKQPHQRTIYDIKNMYGVALANKSHGEGFVTFFKSRIINNGLYILDEPESALSYENQYLIAILIRDAVKKGCQFIIATHSPIITAIPEAGLYEINEGIIEKTSYESLENIQFLNMFVRKRQYLFEED
ncbi:AAA family ATPase [Fusibacter bizertensis]